MNNKIKILILVLLALVGPAWGEATSMITYTKLEGGVNKPEANSITFAAYYNNDDSKIQTEDSWNDTNTNEGYVATSGACRVKPDQMASDQTGQPYTIWISYSGTGGNQGGNAGASAVPSSGTGYTTPGNTLANPFILSAGNYLPAPANVTAYAGNGETFIKWNAVTGATGYRIYKRPATGEGPTEIVFERAAATGQLGYVDSGITNGQAYNYIVIATDAARRSGHGTETTVTPTPVSVPVITGPPSGTIGQPITITGSNLGSTAGTVFINGSAATVSSWATTQISATIDASTPTGSGKLVVITSGNLEGSINFTANAPDTQPPTMTILPVNGATNVSMTQEVVVTFSEQMNTSSVNYTLSPDPGGKNAVWSNGDKVLTISHNSFTAGANYTFTVTAAKDLAGNSFTGNNSSSFNVINNQGKYDFPIAYLSETQADNWISVPYQSAKSGAVAIITIGDLMNSLGNSFTPQTGDIMTLAWYDNATQTPTNIQRDYDGSKWNAWDPARETTVISTGEMFIVNLSNGGGRATFVKTWEVSGTIPPIGTVHYPLAYLSETQSENWIATPNSSTITTHGSLIDSITGAFTPQTGDILTLSWYDNTAQVPTNIQRDYDGSKWNAWDPATESQTTILGKPYKMQLSNPGRNTFNVIWP